MIYCGVFMADFSLVRISVSASAGALTSLITPQTSKRFTEILLWKRHEKYPDDKVCDVTQALPNGERCIHIPI